MPFLAYFVLGALFGWITSAAFFFQSAPNYTNGRLCVACHTMDDQGRIACQHRTKSD